MTRKHFHFFPAGVVDPWSAFCVMERDSAETLGWITPVLRGAWRAEDRMMTKTVGVYATQEQAAWALLELETQP